MDIIFEKMANKHRIDIIRIFNYYIENSFAAYPDKIIPESYYDKFLEIANNYPAYSIQNFEKTIGFCFLHSYNPLSTFKETTEITYFIDKDFIRKGIGKMALKKLEFDAKQYGIKNLLANIVSVNQASIKFHKNNGFIECGRFYNIYKKNNSVMDIVWMQKQLHNE